MCANSTLVIVGMRFPARCRQYRLHLAALTKSPCFQACLELVQLARKIGRNNRRKTCQLKTQPMPDEGGNADHEADNDTRVDDAAPGLWCLADKQYQH